MVGGMRSLLTYPYGTGSGICHYAFLLLLFFVVIFIYFLSF